MHVVGSVCWRNIWTFLELLMVIMVSGDAEYDTMTVNGQVSGSVLLPCSCSNIDLNRDFTWQKNEKEAIPMSKSNRAVDNYKGRVKIFQSESIDNCSLLLSNITAGDEGKYQCSYFRIPMNYERVFVNLNVSVNPSLSAISNPSTPEPVSILIQPLNLSLISGILIIALALGIYLVVYYRRNITRKKKYTETDVIFQDGLNSSLVTNDQSMLPSP